MRISYLLTYNPGPGSGVWKKIADQVRLWAHDGCEVRVHMLSQRDVPTQATIGGAALDVEVHKGVVDLIPRLARLTNRVRSWGPELIYLRYTLAHPPLWNLAKSLPTVVEINSNDVTEYRLASMKQDVYNRLTRGRLLSKVAGIVSISHELSEIHDFKSFARPSMVIGNGVDLSRFPRRINPPQNIEPRLVMLAQSPKQSPWLGLDKVTLLAKRFPRWQFDLVGITKDHLTEPQLSNVTTHGVLQQAQYESLMLRADVALGTLSLHRIKGFNESSPLKLREYLAYRIPTIIGHKDPDIFEEMPYVLQLPNTPDNVTANVDSIREFAERHKGCRIPPEKVAHIDSRVKEKQRLEFFQSILTKDVPS